MRQASGARVLFQTYNRRGLGHLVRGLNVAHALREIDPSATTVFFARSPVPDGFATAGDELIVESDADAWRTGWPRLVQSLEPDVIVYDTMLGDDAGLETVRVSPLRVFVMRRSKPERQSAIFDSEALRRVDLILVPHTPEEFGHVVPERLAERAVFVGPIVRCPTARATRHLRDKYDLRDDTFLLTSTPGGGGFERDAESFFDVARRVHRALEAHLPDLRHVLVPGPRFTGAVAVPEGITVAATEPDLVALLALSDVVLSAGGYNTVHEIRVTGTPAIFLAGARTHDDQHERVERLARRGQAWVPSSGSPDAVAAEIAALCLAPDRLAEMRRKLAAEPLVPGNLEAARQILAALET